MNKGLFRKGIVFGILVFFIGVGVVSSTVGNRIEKINIVTIGSPGYIQDLIDNASDGDIIYIPSGIYYENIVINKSISLIGEDKNITIIDGKYFNNVVYISADKVTISGFKIQNSGIGWAERYSGIIVASDHNFIKENIIFDNDYGIELYGNNNNILRNIISNNNGGVIFWYSHFNLIIKNNFINNEQDSYFSQSFINRWIKNFWNESRILPKPIFGEYRIPASTHPPGGYIIIPMLHFDWRPAKEPYNL